MQIGDRVLLQQSDTWTPEMVNFDNREVIISGIRMNMFTISDSPNLIFLMDEIKEKLGEAPIGNKEQLYNIAAEVFGEQNVDVIDISYGFQLNIRFPEVIITNSKDLKHEIKDLFVGIQVTNVNIFGVSKGNVTLVGRRGKVSYKEWCSHYSHSHLSSSYNQWQNFCLGNSDIAMLINELKLSFDKDMWYMLFYALPNYVNWESLEGGPYKKIENLSEGSRNIGYEQVKTCLQSFIKHIPKHCFDHSDKLNLIRNHPDLIEFYNQHSSIKTLTNNNINLEQINREAICSFRFKEETIKLSIYHNETQEQQHVSQDVIDWYNDMLQEELNKFNENYEQQKYNDLWFEQIIGESYAIQ